MKIVDKKKTFASTSIIHCYYYIYLKEKQQQKKVFSKTKMMIIIVIKFSIKKVFLLYKIFFIRSLVSTCMFTILFFQNCVCGCSHFDIFLVIRMCLSLYVFLVFNISICSYSEAFTKCHFILLRFGKIAFGHLLLFFTLFFFSIVYVSFILHIDITYAFCICDHRLKIMIVFQKNNVPCWRYTIDICVEKRTYIPC